VTDAPSPGASLPGPAAPGPGIAPPTGDMPAAEFARWASQVVEWVARYLDEVGEFPVLSRVQPGEIRARLPHRPPESGEEMSRILSDFQELILPGVTHWNHPSFFAYFAISGSGPGILGEMLAAALNVNGMLWRTSPAVTELELHVLEWIRDLLGLPPECFGHIQDTASTSSLVALGAARHRCFPEVREEGLSGLPPGRIYASTEAHSSIEKAVIALGLGRRGFRAVEVDEGFRMRPDLLEEAVSRDREAGIRPVAVVATVGTTSTTSSDPVEEIAGIARREGMWLHVDAAYAGPAAMLPERREAFVGWESADSVVVNPHKWLFTPVDCSLLYTRHPDLLREAFSLVPEYLRTDRAGEVVDLMDYGVALGRRFRALKLWFVLRYFGAEGIRARLREHMRLARRFAHAVDDAPDWEVAAPVPFSTVVFRFVPPGREGDELDEANMAVMERVNSGGEAFLSHTRVHGRVALRLAVGNLRTREEHVDRAWELLQEAAAGFEP
jgi:aromatic-L-amino-acid/L-tryptophan decarboxylase